jgi:glutamate-1-semialdehyde 2,1-aminomutase
MNGSLEVQLASAHARYAAQRPHSSALFEQACRVLPGGSTRSVLDFRPFSFRVARAEGSRIVDVDGHEYIDFLGDYSAGLLGHDPGPVAAAVNAALERGWSFGATHVDEIRLAELVCQRFPSIDQVRFTNSGTEANLMALQLARHCTGRDRIAVFDHAYHGGLLYFGHGGEALQAPFDYLRLPYNDLDGVQAVVDETVAALIVEPMMGAAGCIPAEPGFLAGLRDVCDRTGALLIFDEVMTSRMSSGGVQLRSGVDPDLTTLGKYLAGGMTFGAFGGRADLMAAFDPHRGGELTHGGTFNNNVVTMAGGVAALSELLTADVLDTLFERGEHLRANVASILERCTLPLSVTGMGSMFAIHAVAGPVRSPADLAGTDEVLKELLFHHLVERGIFLAARGFVAMSLAITDADCEQFVDALTDSVAAIEAGLRPQPSAVPTS